MAEKTDIVDEFVSSEPILDESISENQINSDYDAQKEKDDLIKKIENLDETVLPNKDEILRKIKLETEKKESMGMLLPIGLFFQFIFTVSGGGMFIAGLIAGFSVKWDTTLEDGIANISIVLTAVGFVLFVIGIILTFVLYKAALKRYIIKKLK